MYAYHRVGWVGVDFLLWTDFGVRAWGSGDREVLVEMRHETGEANKNMSLIGGNIIKDTCSLDLSVARSDK
jgi:hypothetical protein